MLQRFQLIGVAAILLVAHTASGQPIYPEPTTPILPPGTIYPPNPYVPPVYPVYSSPTYVTGVTPWWGVNTAGTTVYNSAYSPWRTASMYNGTLHYVNRPIYNQWGQIVGYKQGEAWTDSVTGQQHFDGNVTTPNGLGGNNVQHVVMMANPGSTRGTTTTSSSYNTTRTRGSFWNRFRGYNRY